MAPETSPVLEISELHAYRGTSYVLQGVSLRADRGACTTLLGRNGMGKTTLMRCLMGLTPIAKGVARFGSASLSHLEPNQVARLGLGFVPQGRHVFPSLTVHENLTLAARASKKSHQTAWPVERVYELFPNLKNRHANWAGHLSGGEQQMLAIGRALMTNPQLLLMDEPSEGLAPVIVESVERIIASLVAEGISILLVEQNYRLGVRAAHQVYILAKGVVVWQGKPSELDEAEEVKRVHLGV